MYKCRQVWDDPPYIWILKIYTCFWYFALVMVDCWRSYLIYHLLLISLACIIWFCSPTFFVFNIFGIMISFSTCFDDDRLIFYFGHHHSQRILQSIRRSILGSSSFVDGRHYYYGYQPITKITNPLIYNLNKYKVKSLVLYSYFS